MSLEYFQEQLEAEREWRDAEIRFLNNTQRGLAAAEQKLIRRSILCLIYAHIEGFVKFAFSLYIDEVNKENLRCGDVKPAIAAAAFHAEFSALRDSKKRSDIFRRKLPDDRRLHRLAREIEFIESIEGFFDHPVRIPEGFVNTESNVGQPVLEKMLYQVGLQYQDLRGIYAPLNRLLQTRNDIAHGKRRAGIEDKDYTEFLTCAELVISSISRRLTGAFGRKDYLQTG